MVAFAIANGRPPAQIGARTFYASKCGLRADGVRTSTTSGTDNSARLQKILDDWGTDPLEFVFDGDHNGLTYLLNTIYVYSNTTLRADHGAWLLRQPRSLMADPSTATAMIRNKNPVASGASTDTNIRLIGLRIDGNRRNKGSGGNDATHPYLNDSLYGVASILMVGVTDIYVENSLVHDSPCWSTNLCNVQDALFVGYRRTQQAGDTYLGDSVVQLEGNCSRIRMFGLSGQTNDDPVAINASDGNPPTVGDGFEPGTYAEGPITDIDVIGSQFITSGSPCRFLSATAAAYIARVRISNMTASCGYAGYTFDNFGLSGDGAGYIQDVTIENSNLSSLSWPAVIIERCKVDQLKIRNLTLNGCTFTGTYYDAVTPNAPVVITAGATVRHLELDGVEIYDSAGNITGPMVQMSGGSIDDFRIGRLRWDRANNVGIADGVVRQTGGQIGRLRFRDCQVDGVRNMVNIVGASCGAVDLSGIVHANNIGGALVRVDGTTLPKLRAAALNAHRLSETVNSGAIIDSANDGTVDGLTIKLLDRGTDTNGTNLTAHTMDVGSGWTAGSGTWGINASNQIVRTSTGSNEHAWANASAASGFASCLMNTGANVANAYVGMVGRVTDDSNLWVAILNPFPSSGNPRVDLYDQITGSYTLRGTSDMPLAANTVYRFKMVFNGNNILVFVDDKLHIVYNSSFNNSATKFGLASSAGTPAGRTFDDFLMMG